MTPRDVTLKRLKMRSIRRGIKEMDLILTDFADRHLPGLSDAELTTYEAFLAENDHDIYNWITTQAEPPAAFAELVTTLRADAHGLTRPA